MKALILNEYFLIGCQDMAHEKTGIQHKKVRMTHKKKLLILGKTNLIFPQNRF